MSLLICVIQLAHSLCPARSDVNCGADLKFSGPRVGEERTILLPLFYVYARRPYVHDVNLYQLMFVNVGEWGKRLTLFPIPCISVIQTEDRKKSMRENTLKTHGGGGRPMCKPTKPSGKAFSGINNP